MDQVCAQQGSCLISDVAKSTADWYSAAVQPQMIIHQQNLNHHSAIEVHVVVAADDFEVPCPMKRTQNPISRYLSTEKIENSIFTDGHVASRYTADHLENVHEHACS